MNGPGDISFTHNSTTGSCNLIAIIPSLGMSSCRGRAEAFARRLSSKLRTLGSQADNEAASPEDEQIINGANAWVTTTNDSDHTVTNLQPLRHETDSFFDFDCELESPGSPVDECEYLRLIETASNTPHNSAPESGYACTSAASSHSSTDGPYFGASNAIPSSSLLNHSILKQSKQFSDSKTLAAEGSVPSDSIQTITVSTCCNNCIWNGVNNPLLNELQEDSSKLTNSDEYNNKQKESFQSEINSDEYNKPTESFHNESSSDDYNEQAESFHNESNSDEYNKETELFQDEHKENTFGPVDSAYSSDGTISIQENIIKELQRESQEISLIRNTEFCEVSDKSIDTDLSNETVLNETSNSKKSNLETSLKAEVCDIKIDTTENEQEKPSTDTLYENNAKQTQGEQELKTTATLNLSSPEKSQLSALDTTDDEDDCRPQRVRRCSSLKTGKTPPGTPGRKKIVRFADVLGLDLADIKTFLDEIPTIPKSAFEDLEVLESEPPIQLGPKSDKLLMPLFQQPGGLSTFLDLVREKQVSLENAAVTDHINQTITGSVRVRNLDFHKSVHIRYTLDNWRSYADLQANYVEKSCDGFSDKFTFTLFGNSLQIGQRLEFAVRFQCKGQQFWDNNYGTNYCFQCLPTSSPAVNPIAPIVPSHHSNNAAGLLSPAAGDAWCTSFY